MTSSQNSFKANTEKVVLTWDSDEESNGRNSSVSDKSGLFSRTVSDFGMQCSVKNTFLDFTDQEADDQSSCASEILKGSVRLGRSRSQPCVRKGSGTDTQSATSYGWSDTPSTCMTPNASPRSSSAAEQPSSMQPQRLSLDQFIPTELSDPCEYSSFDEHDRLSDTSGSPNAFNSVTRGQFDLLTASPPENMVSSKAQNKGQHPQQPQQPSRGAAVATRPQTQSVTSPTTTELHASGQCRPCMWMNSSVGCSNGSSCHFCHMPHRKKNRPRPSKAHRAQCKQMVNMLQTLFTPESEQFQELSHLLAAKSGYMRSLIGSADQPLAN